MKWFIASDIHGSAHYCEKLLESYKREGADKMLLLGDVLWDYLALYSTTIDRKEALEIGENIDSSLLEK